MFSTHGARIKRSLTRTTVLLLVVGAGAASAGASQARTPPPPPGSAPPPVVTATGGGGGGTCPQLTPFSPAIFANPTLINNRFSPMKPGTQLTLEGRANLGGGVLPHTVVFTVTDLTKVINGVPTVVVWDRDFQDGELVEAELAFFAQDSAGNVWSLGEYPEEYEDGVFTGAPSTWISGVAGAVPGTLVPGDPRLGRDWFLQGFAPDIEFLDCAKVTQTGEQVCVPTGCYTNVLVVRERSPLAGDGAQLKYYAPGVGNVQVAAVNDPEGETLVLVKYKNLRRNALADAREEALKLEQRAYQVSPVYQTTAPAS